MVGIPGSGKSFFAEHFAVTFNAPYVSFGRIAEQVFSSNGIDNIDTVAAVADYLLAELLKTGQTVIYEGETDSRVNRQSLIKLARDNGYEPLMVWVQTESLASKDRAVRQRKAKTLTSEQFDSAIKRFTPPNVTEKAVVISGKHTYASQLKIVLNRLTSSRKGTVETQPAVFQAERRSIPIR